MDIVIYTRNEAFHTSTDYEIDPELNKDGQLKVYLYGFGGAEGKYLEVEPDGTMFLDGETVTSVERVYYEDLSEEELINEIKSDVKRKLGESSRRKGSLVESIARRTEKYLGE